MQELWLIHDNHSVGEANLHLQFTPKYRKPVFGDEVIRFACQELFKGLAKKLGVGLAGIGFGPDHCHLFITGWKNYSIRDLAKRLKGPVSRMIRKNYGARLQKWLWGDAFWTGGYFYRTVGAVNNETMLRYITESQQKHWKKSNQPATSQQTTLLQGW